MNEHVAKIVPRLRSRLGAGTGADPARDRAAVQDVCARYCRAADRLDMNLLRTCFTPGARLDYRPVYRGDVDGLVTRLKSQSSLAGCATTMHVPATVAVDLAGDRAEAETYCVAYHVTTSAHPWAGDFVIVGLRYLDRLRRTGDGWRITCRTCRFEWQQRHPSTTTLQDTLSDLTSPR